jgi:hypothetical protein
MHTHTHTHIHMWRKGLVGEVPEEEEEGTM